MQRAARRKTRLLFGHSPTQVYNQENKQWKSPVLHSSIGLVSVLFACFLFFPQCVKEPNKKLLSAIIFTE